jgi:putative transposase
MSATDRRGLLLRDHETLSIRRQCKLLSVARSNVYRLPRPANDDDLLMMRLIDGLFTAWPFLGSRRVAVMLREKGYSINRKRVQRLMRKMGIAALGPKPRTTKPSPGHKIFPYLLRNLVIDRPNQVWSADITYIPIGRGFLYLVAVIDWASRAVLAWRLSNTMDVSFCVSALEEAMARFGRPEIFNTDQGSQFTSAAFTGTLAAAEIKISMDGRGRWMDNVFIERLWRSLKYEDIYLKGYADGRESQGRHRFLDGLLQSPAPAPGAGEPDADGGLAQWHDRRARRPGCGYDACPADKLGQRCRVAHISTASTTAAGFSRVRVQENRTVELPTTKPDPVVLTQGSTSLMAGAVARNREITAMLRAHLRISRLRTGVLHVLRRLGSPSASTGDGEISRRIAIVR